MQASPFTSSKSPSLPFEDRETDTDAAHPCSLVNATINGHSQVWKDKLLNRTSPCGYPCPSCRTLSAAAFSASQQQCHCSTPSASKFSSSISSTAGHLGPTLIRTLVPRSSPNIPTSPFTTYSNSQTEGLECRRACPRALSIKCLDWLGLAFSTKASSNTLGYLLQSLTLGHSTACFLFCLHTAESRWRDH